MRAAAAGVIVLSMALGGCAAHDDGTIQLSQDDAPLRPGSPDLRGARLA
ncbi:hypothetical protein AA0Z99_07345 [Agrococcus sp. 1P02AA]